MYKYSNRNAFLELETRAMKKVVKEKFVEKEIV